MQKRRISSFILIGSIFLYFPIASAQTYTFPQSLNWQIITKIPNKKIKSSYFLGFSNATYSATHPLTPVFSSIYALALPGKIHAYLKNEVYSVVTDSNLINQLDYLPDHIDITASLEEIRYDPVAAISVVPIRKNSNTGQIERLEQFTLILNVEPVQANYHPISQAKRSSGSLLANGDWYKIGVNKTGIYKLDYNFLKGLGIPANTDLTNVKIYGRSGGMLPQLCNAPRDSDLVQNAIQVVSSNGKLDPSSYILFYANGPVSWTYDTTTHHYHHQINYYSDISYYFITANGDQDHPAKRIQNGTGTGTPTNEITGFDAYDYHELDTVTSISTSVKSGREWYGESFSAYQLNLYHTINFDFPQADLSAKMYMRTSTAARSYPNGSSFDFSLDNGANFILRNSVDHVQSLDDFTDAYDSFNDTASLTRQTPFHHFNLYIKFNPGSSDALGWLNYVEFNIPSALSYIQGQFNFRTGSSINNGINRYHISGAPANLQVWDVTDFHNVVNKPLTQQNNDSYFLAPGDVLREFVATDGTGYYAPGAYGKIANQDLHSLPLPDMVIVTHPDFISAADSIADFHRKHDNMVVHIVTPDQVYNEFSSGTQDVSAIRDMMRMFYLRGASIHKPPHFLLLIGAASYDYKNRLKNHTNLIPTYQGDVSNYAAWSFCTDDYFAMLSNGQGGHIDDGDHIQLQMSVGRLPVYNLQQAMDIYHKIQRYTNPQSMNDWRNRIALIADDRNQNYFQTETETIDYFIRTQHPGLNIKKLYLDATPETNTSAGQLFPQINQAIDDNIGNGCLIMNYVGHGGQMGWAHEKVLTIPMINAWTNKYRMPLIISATCQFSTFDDPDNISAGQLALFNPNGGPFALLTTTREVDEGSNSQLNNAILNKNLLEQDPSTRLPKYIGDAFIYSKNTSQSSNNLNFTLLGDPAIRLALPQYDVKITNIKRQDINSDTFKALSLMTVSGEVDKGGNIIKSFNGDIYPTVFDKAELKTTLGQALHDPSDSDWPMTFSTQEKIIYKGKVSVDSGKFSFQFVVPLDISFANGKGKLSFYASNSIIDASGYDTSIVVGGSDENAVISKNPPLVKLFMNDTNFISGGMTNENPVLLAKVKSDLGVNTLGSVGHDLLATLTRTDNVPTDKNGTIVLNDYYTADKNSYQSGTITYPYKALADGHYQLNVKVWDVADNSADASTDFVVVSSSKLTIDKIFNYPNPFKDQTTFNFEDNRPNETLHVDITIFDLRGQQVHDIQADLLTAGDRHTELTWNGMNAGGAKLSAGLYIYQLTVKTSDGQIAQKSQKLVLIK
jgi:hypothetical protein